MSTGKARFPALWLSFRRMECMTTAHAINIMFGIAALLWLARFLLVLRTSSIERVESVESRSHLSAAALFCISGVIGALGHTLPGEIVETVAIFGLVVLMLFVK